MRSILLIALALGGCYRDSEPTSTSPPSNKLRPDNHARDAEDELAFLPKESEIVVGLDMTTLRASAAWRDQIEPALAQSDSLAKTRKLCGFDPFAPITHVAIGARASSSFNELVATIAGGDAQQEIACGMKQLDAQFTTHADGDVTVIENTSAHHTHAVAPVGRSHVLVVSSPRVDAARFHAQVAVGSPLRSSAAFMALYDKLERGASLWFVLNGASPLFDSLSLGVRPRYVDGTLVVTDRYLLTTRVTMSSSSDASQLATMLRGAVTQVKQMVETLEIREDGAVLHVDIGMTQPQVQAVLGMLGGLVGP
jgi:hypothetical protein